MVLAARDDDFELRVPSPPARRLSRSSIDLRDLEHEKGKIVSQSESVSSICQLQYDHFLRSSGSEPIPVGKESINYFQNLEENFVAQPTNTNLIEKAFAIPFFMKNNHSKSDSKNLFNNHQIIMSRTSSNTSTTAVKDNQTTINDFSLDNSNVNASKHRRKLLASSDSDFYSIIRNNSEKMHPHGGKNANSNLISSSMNNKSNNTKNLSDSDFLKSDNNKFCNKDKILNINKAIVNKSDIFELLMNNKHIDYKNLVDNKLANNNHNNGKIIDFPVNTDKPDILVDLFDKESCSTAIDTEKYRENITKAQSDENFLIKNHVQTSKNSTLRQSCNNFINNSMIETTKQLSNKQHQQQQQQQSSTATSLPPYSQYTQQNAKKVLNTSKSTDEIIQHNDKDLIRDSMKDINKIDNTTLNINNQLQLSASDAYASTISLDLVTISKSLETHNKSTSKAANENQHHDNPDSSTREFQFQLQQPDIIDINQSPAMLTIKSESNFNDTGDSNNKLTCDVDVANKKRKSSGVTYNVNVINFQRDDIDPKIDYSRSGGNTGARSNSSTSEIFFFVIYSSLIKHQHYLSVQSFFIFLFLR